MAKITRKTQKIFADSAAASQITAFGSIKANSPNPPVYSKDPDVIQSNEFMQGWSGATQDDYAPYRQDMNAIQNLVTRQLAYLFQAGIPEYDSSTQYYANCSFCQINGVVYLCIQDALNKLPTTEPTYWKEIDFDSFAPIDSPAFTGNPTAPTQLNTDNSTKIATTAFVKNIIGGYAPIDSPIFTGNPTAPTQTANDNSDKLATTKYVETAIANSVQISMPTGTIVMYGSSNVPTGYLSCNGAAISRTTYADLFAVIGTRFGAGDGSTTFNLPSFEDRYPIGSGLLTVGTHTGQSLPNITGTTNGYPYNDSTGAFTQYNRANSFNMAGTSAPSAMSFDASQSNNIYGATIGNLGSGRVIPYSTCVQFIIKY